MNLLIKVELDNSRRHFAKSWRRTTTNIKRNMFPCNKEILLHIIIVGEELDLQGKMSKKELPSSTVIISNSHSSSRISVEDF